MERYPAPDQGPGEAGCRLYHGSVVPKGPYWSCCHYAPAVLLCRAQRAGLHPFHSPPHLLQHVVEVSPTGMVSILGGKWTTYRRMAEDAVDAVSRVPCCCFAVVSALPRYGIVHVRISPACPVWWRYWLRASSWY